MEVRLALSTLEDLESIRHYYGEQGVPQVGERLVREMLRHIETLKEHPEIGRVVPEFDTPSLRELIRAPFRIVYRCESKRVTVVRVWRSERLLRLADTDQPEPGSPQETET